jgi:hypothetical protein
LTRAKLSELKHGSVIRIGRDGYVVCEDHKRLYVLFSDEFLYLDTCVGTDKDTLIGIYHAV